MSLDLLLQQVIQTYLQRQCAGFGLVWQIVLFTIILFYPLEPLAKRHFGMNGIIKLNETPQIKLPKVRGFLQGP